MKLYGYWRSSASYRLRIALALKGLHYETITVDLRIGEQRSDAHLKRNPRGLVPVLELENGEILTQSLAIIDYLERLQPEPPLLSPDPIICAKITATTLSIAADISPIQNLSVLQQLEKQFDAGQEEKAIWARYWIEAGFNALEPAAQQRQTPYLYTIGPSLFELCLIPQIYNARRWGVEMNDYPALKQIESQCLSLAAFEQARPENQPDAPISTEG